ncbi:mannonate dehydratase [Paenibacillus alginolyticus]|uniref:mannonate dehydratase n=1 Tax=Paenibacillus alginolyticus TaxID=59839 RepID=A0ABT4GMB9_9BACL|nr:mannonate dehydratase [Paenibacillus alginolyticus]MCY9697357.1 mannonate dehydratase [Paenibacillus alginolyticus]MEC0146205.1 mannonate dehydratase [Paenibacillus alginolyticus]
MIRISISTARVDHPDSYLKQLVQLGADCLDFGNGSSFVGVKEQGYPDLDELLKLRRRLRSFGLDINRVTLPNMSERFMRNLPGSEKELDHTVNAMKVFGEAGVPIIRQRFAGDTFDQLMTKYDAVLRGGYISRGESIGLTKQQHETPTYEELQAWWERFLTVYGQLVPIADSYKVKLSMHPSDTPNTDTPFGGLGYHRVTDAFPSKQVGYLYCIGTRAEAGGSSLVLDEINHYGRQGRIHLIHMRNVRGSLPTSGGFEETLLDDGDLNMFKVLMALKKVGYDGCINPDHIPFLEGDDRDRHSGDHRTACGIGLAYSIGYLKALLCAMYAV